MNEDLKKQTQESVDINLEDDNLQEDVKSEVKDDLIDKETKLDFSKIDISKVEKLEEEVANLKADLLRSEADKQNLIRRNNQEIDKARKFALEKFSQDLLQVTDSLEQGLKIELNENNKTVLDGMDLTFKLILDIFKKYGIEQIGSEGDKFNPEMHQAISKMQNLEKESNTVLNVFQKGYLINGRVIRPAMVVVNS